MKARRARQLSFAEALEEVLLRHGKLGLQLAEMRKEVRDGLATLQEQVQTLTDTLTAMSTSMDVIGGDVQQLVSDLQAANANSPPTVDLTPQIAQAQGILARMTAAQTAAAAGLPP